jgi:sRNA-binding carbon storage regulator CsrA
MPNKSLLELEIEVGGQVVIETTDQRQITLFLRPSKRHNQVSFAIEADRDIPIMRSELLER